MVFCRSDCVFYLEKIKKYIRLIHIEVLFLSAELNIDV